MALIKCSECGREASDRATACPFCGCHIPAGELSGEEAKRIAKMEERVARKLQQEPVKPVRNGLAFNATVWIVVILILGALIYAFSRPSGSSPPRPDDAKRQELDRKVGQHFVTYGGGMVENCTVDSSGIPGGGVKVYAKIYFREVPTDLRPSLTYICESIHEVYKSGVELEAYGRTANGTSWKQVAHAKFDIFNKTSTVEMY